MRGLVNGFQIMKSKLASLVSCLLLISSWWVYGESTVELLWRSQIANSPEILLRKPVIEHTHELSGGGLRLLVSGKLSNNLAVIDVAANGTLQWRNQMVDSPPGTGAPLTFPVIHHVHALSDDKLRLLVGIRTVNGQGDNAVIVIDVLANGTLQWRDQIDNNSTVTPLVSPVIDHVHALSDGKLRLLVSGRGSYNVVVIDVAVNGTLQWRGQIAQTPETPLLAPEIHYVRDMNDGWLRLLVSARERGGQDSVVVIDVPDNGEPELQSQIANSMNTPLQDPKIDYIYNLSGCSLRLLISGKGSGDNANNVVIIDVPANGMLQWRSHIANSPETWLIRPVINHVHTLNDGRRRLLISNNASGNAGGAIIVIDLLANGTLLWQDHIANSDQTPLGDPVINYVHDLNDDCLRLLVSGTGSDNVAVIDVAANGTLQWRSQIANNPETPLDNPVINYVHDLDDDRLRLLVNGRDSNNIAIIDIAANGTLQWRDQIVNNGAVTPLVNPEIDHVHELNDSGLRLLVSGRGSNNVVVIDLKEIAPETTPTPTPTPTPEITPTPSPQISSSETTLFPVLSLLGVSLTVSYMLGQ